MANEKKVLEAHIVKEIQRAVTRCGGVCIKLHGGPFQEAGLPDLLVIINGAVTFLEVKTTRGRVSRLQELQIDRLRAAGAAVFVVRSLEEAGNALNQKW